MNSNENSNLSEFLLPSSIMIPSFLTLHPSDLRSLKYLSENYQKTSGTNCKVATEQHFIEKSA